MLTRLFDQYKQISKLIDDKLQKLTRIWGSLHNLFGGCDEHSDEAKNNLQNIGLSQKNDELKEDSSNRFNYLNDMDQFLKDCHTVYNDLKQGTDDIELLFAEYGFSGSYSGSEEKIDTETNGSKFSNELENIYFQLQSISKEQIDFGDNDDVENCLPNKRIINNKK